MAMFLMFGKYSAEGIKGIDAKRTEKASGIINKFGGQYKGGYALLGQYDLVLMLELPGVEEAMKASIALHKLTGISFSTSQAVPIDQFDRIVAGA